MYIKTLAEILAESESDSASNAESKRKNTSKRSSKSHSKQSIDPTKLSDASSKNQLSDSDLRADVAYTDTPFYTHADKKPSTPPHSKRKKRKRFHPAANFAVEPNDVPAYHLPEAQSIQEMLAEVKREVHSNQTPSVLDSQRNLGLDSVLHPQIETTNAPIEDTTASETDNLPSALKAYLRTPEQRQAEVDVIKAESRLRWLAFYYLSRREYGKAELKQKLIDKEQSPDRIDALLDEFEAKGYQSDYRTTLMLIRENIRKGRGRGRIKQEFYRKKIAMPSNIDELIDMANTESDEFSEFVDEDEDSLVEGVDWLKLAVIARTKKYGDDLPIEQKDKARQLRFLQYRGFKNDICFQALGYTLDTIDERF